jgi:hypothetical protein
MEFVRARRAEVDGRLQQLIGRQIVLDDVGLRPCRCGADRATVEAGQGPHLFRLRCPQCGNGSRWLGRSAGVKALRASSK